MRSSRQLGIVAALLLQLLPARADDVITNIISPIASYQYPNDFSSEALTNGGIQSSLVSFQYLQNFSNAALTSGGIMSPLVSYQYFEWPGDDVLRLQSSPLASYYYQYLNAPSLIVVQTDRVPKTAETTPVTSFPYPSQSQLETFMGGVFTTDPPFPPDPSKMTVVLAHGWNSNPNEWAKGMAALMVSKFGPNSPNIFAWDWTDAAQSVICDPGTPEARTMDQGAVLGQALLAKLGPNYSQPIHFLGHSLGTLVNAAAANYLHTTSAKGAAAYPPSQTHVTLFDEAEIAKDVGCSQFGIKIVQLITKIGNPLAPKTPTDNPLPKQFAWADNYVSAFGVFHENAANVLLTNGLPTTASSLTALFDAIAQFHGYPHKWYTNSIGNVAGNTALMGFRWSFEESGLASPPPVKTAFVQALNASELDLVKKDYDELNGKLLERVQHFRSTAYSTAGQIINDTLTGHGQVTPDMLTAGPPTGAGNTIMNWIVNLFTRGGGASSLGPVRGPRPLDGGGGTNAPAYAWLPLFLPNDAVAMSFDFKVQGDWADDSVAAALNGTNCLSLPGSQLETNILLSSGPIDVSALAGRTNEFFVGIVGGTSTNAQLTVQDVQFYGFVPPLLQATASGQNISVSWPFSPQGFNLQSTTNLATPTWTPVTNAPTIVDLQNTVTNTVLSPAALFRLAKP